MDSNIPAKVRHTIEATEIVFRVWFAGAFVMLVVYSLITDRWVLTVTVGWVGLYAATEMPVWLYLLGVGVIMLAAGGLGGF